MPTTVIHFLKHKSKAKKLVTKAIKRGLDAFLHNESAVCISGPETSAHKSILKKHSKKCKRHKYVVLSEDAQNLSKYKSHLRIHPKFFDEKMSAMAVTSNYGQTAGYLSKYYNFPAPSSSAPTIAIISLGGGYQLSDLQTYWSKIMGLSKYPQVINISVDGAVARYTGTGADQENTLDLEIAGGICPNATLLFYSAPNTDQGFYNAINAAVKGSTIGGKLYKASIISISWGGPESQWNPTTMLAYNQLFQSAVSQGITICAAAGDDGSSDGVSDGKPHVDFPASSPYVIACGGTSISAGKETAWAWN
ncbi:MAG: S53 family peptidase, partial [Burkholderiaceae bacterium]